MQNDNLFDDLEIGKSESPPKPKPSKPHKKEHFAPHKHDATQSQEPRNHDESASDEPTSHPDTKEQNLSPKVLLGTYAAIILALALLLPRIYIKNQIYYISRDISALWSEYSILVEENRDLRQKVESVRFKHQVLDTLEIE
jgi:cell division protein FtsL